MPKFSSPIDASERTLADGRVVVPGEPIELSKDDLKDPHNMRLIEEGQLLEIKKEESK